MTMHAQCDYCGEPIADDERLMELHASGYFHTEQHGWRYSNSDLGHYHASGEQPCWAEMLDRIRLVHAVSSDLGPDREALECRIEHRAARQRKQEEQQEEHREHDERMRAWQRKPKDERDGLLLRALGDRRLTIRELTARLNEELDSPEGRSPTVYEGTINKMATRLINAGELERIGEPFQGNVRYRYFRAGTVLDGRSSTSIARATTRPSQPIVREERRSAL
jgi:hypothetical protein